MTNYCDDLLCLLIYIRLHKDVGRAVERKKNQSVYEKRPKITTPKLERVMLETQPPLASHNDGLAIGVVPRLVYIFQIVKWFIQNVEYTVKASAT